MTILYSAGLIVGLLALIGAAYSWSKTWFWLFVGLSVACFSYVSSAAFSSLNGYAPIGMAGVIAMIPVLGVFAAAGAAIARFIEILYVRIVKKELPTLGRFALWVGSTIAVPVAIFFVLEEFAPYIENAG